MTDMIEVVARALFALDKPEPMSFAIAHAVWDSGLVENGGDLTRGAYDKCTKRAVKSIEAHKASLKERGLVIVPREPTEAMVAAYVQRYEYAEIPPGQVASDYTAMITAALGEG